VGVSRPELAWRFVVVVRPPVLAFPIICQLKDYRVDRTTVESLRSAFDGIRQKRQPRTWALVHM
jgi:hypothetical protein